MQYAPAISGPNQAYIKNDIDSLRTHAARLIYIQTTHVLTASQQQNITPNNRI